jgi:cytochrome c oxidase subunit 4
LDIFVSAVVFVLESAHLTQAAGDPRPLNRIDWEVIFMDAHYVTRDDSKHDTHGGLGQYIAVFVALCALSTASFITTSRFWPFHDQPHVGWAFMMAVSCTKALLVILFFMHVKYEANWKYVLTIPAAFMSIFLLLMLVPDVGMRNRYASEESELYMAEPLKVDMEHARSTHSSDDYE